MVLGYRLKVYRAEGTTQWFTAVVGSYNEDSGVRKQKNTVYFLGNDTEVVSRFLSLALSRKGRWFLCLNYAEGGMGTGKRHQKTKTKFRIGFSLEEASSSFRYIGVTCIRRGCVCNIVSLLFDGRYMVNIFCFFYVNSNSIPF